MPEGPEVKISTDFLKKNVIAPAKFVIDAAGVCRKIAGGL